MNTPDHDPIFSERQVRDEDTRAEALALHPYYDSDFAFTADGERADDFARVFRRVIEDTFTEMDRLAKVAPELLTALPNYTPETPGTYGAAAAPYFFKVMKDVVAGYDKKPRLPMDENGVVLAIIDTTCLLSGDNARAALPSVESAARAAAGPVLDV